MKIIFSLKLLCYGTRAFFSLPVSCFLHLTTSLCFFNPSSVLVFSARAFFIFFLNFFEIPSFSELDSSNFLIMMALFAAEMIVSSCCSEALCLLNVSTCPSNLDAHSLIRKSLAIRKKRLERNEKRGI